MFFYQILKLYLRQVKDCGLGPRRTLLLSLRLGLSRHPVCHEYQFLTLNTKNRHTTWGFLSFLVTLPISCRNSITLLGILV